ncbi:hypothetical protein [Helicobacter labetoulli]|uniref:hypothetical protein n=1 Tax=Helicobacter labetoulli TaxID=2315333 RepID=UPI0013008D4F|nr:hypothetical protein [Helicobacter labetoulli]
MEGKATPANDSAKGARHLNSSAIIPQNTPKKVDSSIEHFEANLKELYERFNSLKWFDEIEGAKRRDMLDNEIIPAIAKHFKPIIEKLKTAENKAQMVKIIKNNIDELSDYLAFHIAKRGDEYVDGYGEGQYAFFSDEIFKLFKTAKDTQKYKDIFADKRYVVLGGIENLKDKATAIHLSFRDINGKIKGYERAPRKQDLLFKNLTLGNDFKSPMLISTKNKKLKEKVIEKLKNNYLDKNIYKDYLENQIENIECYNPKKIVLGNYIPPKWKPQKLEEWKKELGELQRYDKAKAMESVTNPQSSEGE